VKILRYFFVGGVAAAVDIAFFFLFASLAGLNYLVVAPFGFVLATWVNYQLSIRHVFRSGARFKRSREILLVYAISAIGLLINQAVLYVLVAKLGAGGKVRCNRHGVLLELRNAQQLYIRPTLASRTTIPTRNRIARLTQTRPDTTACGSWRTRVRRDGNKPPRPSWGAAASCVTAVSKVALHKARADGMRVAF